MNAIQSATKLALCTMVMACAQADSITVDGKKHESVIVRESAALYYVQEPATGAVWSVAKEKVPEGGYMPTTDVAERARLQAAWKAAKPSKYIEAPKPVPAASAEAESDRATPVLKGRSDGKIPYLRLKNVPLGDALDATLRPMNLDYTVENGFLYISSPELLARESFERVETRTYNVNLDNTLPKIVLSNPFAATAGNFGGGNLGGGGFSNGGGGSGGFGGNTGGGLGNQGGFGGNQGLGNQGGGLGNQNVRDVTTITNISDLFTTIDDRLVGETPAQIGLGIQTR